MNSAVAAARMRINIRDFDGAAQMLVDEFTKNRPRVNKGQGIAYFHKLIPFMLQNGMKQDVAHLLWGKELFDPRPYSVQKIWRALEKNNMSLIIGAGSLGKSYNVAAWFLLDWLADPCHTCVKVVSITSAHNKKNLFALIKRLHKESSIPLPGDPKSDTLMANPDAEQGIHTVAIPIGENGSGRLQGFHPKPRKEVHPVYGTLTRIRAVLDEAEEIPPGVWPDIDNMLIAKDDSTGHVKVAGCANPRDRNSVFGQRCEPMEGWGSIDIEDSHDWENKYGWHITRLDGSMCENVVQRKMVFPGLLTYEGYRRFLVGGMDNREYYTMARGWFPPQGVDSVAIPSEFFDKSIGRANFIGPVTYCASVDLALEGKDKAVMTVGKFGVADGRECMGKSIRFAGPKWVCQVEAQFEIQKSDPEKKVKETIWIARQIMNHCKKTFQIQPKYLIVDRTGNGSGVHDVLCLEFGADVAGLNFGRAATEMKILEDDKERAEDLYDGVVSELFFATRKFMESDSLVISPSVRVDALKKELTTRKFRTGRQGRSRVESKAEYIANGNNSSPDWADSLTLLVHVIRLRKEFRAALVASIAAREDKPPMPSVVDKLEFVDMTT